MGLNVMMEQDGFDLSLLMFSRLQPEVKKATAPILGEIAQKIADRAKSGVKPSHPRNLFKVNNRNLTPSYRTKKRGEFWWTVQTPSGAVGRAEAMAEFASRGFTSQGAALVRALTDVYGRPGGSGGGRILFKARDDMEAELTVLLENAVQTAAAEVEGQMNG